MSLPFGARAKVVSVLLEDVSCRATLEMVRDGLVTVTDADCFVDDNGPGCNLFEIPDCRVCALMSESVADDVPLCVLLEVFNQESEPFGDASVDFDYDEPQIPPPLVPVEPTEPVDPVETPQSSENESYSFVLSSDDSKTESSVWDGTESSTDYAGEWNVGDEQNDLTKSLRPQS
ncbi:uncharacterized protein PITG_04972 [Phytophthora infestans T30-4]|uniref:Uncharacterized protein n=1 Tax=Phytophthora infestans (strain T30-4) TaxID=403677 RepID=D0N2H1_PHYIT|nr:uncharacterized protein PITG_04972 [Phytophthora infestans T30-4]EEY68500.1 conserved hypothetical protein [Phytophthora infestans T30-4]|eukprot:XP_002905659.1 conserved hypothetical protein [Phytophthora infestans T30-4]